MPGLEPRSADLTVAEPTTILPWEVGAPTAGPPPYHPYKITPATVFGAADEYGGRATRYRF